ncbi:hypothetical protein [Zhihengliuella sp. ISTPL4]|uniref:hypothetical protein n=1 Tax=Zhihengliuella sp. ISTPL4 TaxID=2058657 RepID=UPI00130538EA|nr:hypothetical protein [Zhihengliuella sp. ISTPL4]
MKKKTQVGAAAFIALALVFGTAVSASAASVEYTGRSCWWPDNPRMNLNSKGTQTIKVYNDNGSTTTGSWKTSATARNNSVAGTTQRATKGTVSTSATSIVSSGWSSGCKLW